jgi:hypothetical protein
MTLQGLSLRAAVYKQTAATVFILRPWIKLFMAASLKIWTPLLSTDSGILCSPAKPCIMRFPNSQLVTVASRRMSFHKPSLRVFSLSSVPPPARWKAGPMLFAAPEPAPTKLPCTTAAPDALSPNWISETIVDSSTIVPQVLQIPSSILGAGQVLLGQSRRAFAGPVTAGRATGVGARMGFIVLRGFGLLTLGGFGARPIASNCQPRGVWLTTPRCLNCRAIVVVVG